MTRGSVVGLIAAVVIGLLVVSGALILRAPDDHTTLTIQFTDTTGLYVGNDVQTIGVRIGTVTAIEPRGSRVDVTIRVDQASIAADAGALIMQSSLVTDRFVELTPAWASGPTLRDGAIIPVERTRSPANVDDILASVDDLVVALKDTTTDGKDVGDLLRVGAEQLDGNGHKIGAALQAASDALGTVDGKDADLDGIVDDLDSLVTLLATRDTTIRRLNGNVADSAALLADQRDDLSATLATLDRLSTRMTAFVKDNRALVTEDVARAADVLTTIESQRDSLAETFDVMPLVAENISRAFDPSSRLLRVRLDMRRSLVTSALSRNDVCKEYLKQPQLCDELIAADGSGLLDPIFSAFLAAVPEDF
ncbi:hypothetical protein C6I20_01450 [Aeromicrobium sp. A1-2]|uniref:MCE family protein n=1 Tax=Aeromicrobium sp. A1-2 TaxID=2107713 RepID=UPI000E52AE25|nr:MCE family protein [Aeromicrobium sp. A1-2]AXT83985.1 hypothetical protein C6I20_01450 [Aeromicrobium sp. A1-2]